MEDNPNASSGAADDAQAIAAGQDAPGDVVGVPGHASGRFDPWFLAPPLPEIYQHLQSSIQNRNRVRDRR